MSDEELLDFIFLSTPSSQRATEPASVLVQSQCISIHALFAEGDATAHSQIGYPAHFYPRPLRRGRPELDHYLTLHLYFYPRPLRRGRPIIPLLCLIQIVISIHALFAEGDLLSSLISQRHIISIHALFAEGDPAQIRRIPRWQNFYPRPLRRGRRRVPARPAVHAGFLSTPSSQRATW